MAFSVYKYYKDAPPAGKVVIIVGAVGLGVATYYAIRNLIREINRKRNLRGQLKAAQDASKAVTDLAAQGVIPSYSDAQYSGWASAIQNAFNGCDPNSDDLAAVMNAVNHMNNDADVFKLISSFGVRKWDECGWGTGDVESDLVGGVRHELSTNDIALVNKVLANKNITFRF